MVVLILDDDEELLASTADVLRTEGYEVIPINRGKRAIRLIRMDPRIDLLLLDVGLPDLDGWTVARLARRFRPNLPIYMFTGWSVMKKRQGEVDVDGILHKPVELDNLLDILRQHHPPRARA